jgi:hypothetical protein
MALQTIETRLNQYFAEDKNRIVIWYDPEKQYESSIGQLLLVNATLIIVTDKNTLQTKYRLEKEEPESKFLLYTTFWYSSRRSSFSLVFLIEEGFSSSCSSLSLPSFNFASQLLIVMADIPASFAAAYTLRFSGGSTFFRIPFLKLVEYFI